MSHPTMGAWIEIKIRQQIIKDFYKSHPTMGAWIEILLRRLMFLARIVAPHDGCVD